MIENKGFLRIKEKIMNEAEAEAKKIIEEAEAQASSYEEEKKTEVEQFSKQELEKIELEKQLLEDKILAQARLNAHKHKITAREEAIDSLIEGALADLPRDTKYQKFLTDLLKAHKANLKEPLKVGAAKKDVALAKKALTAAKVKGTVSEAPISGGLMIEDSEGKRVQQSLSARLERVKDELRMELAKLIEGAN